TEDTDPLYKLRYFIIDLCLTLKSINNKYIDFYQDQFESSLVVYRGLTLSDNDINELKQSIGKYVSTNGFLSTSLSREVGEKFSFNILSEITIDTRLQKNLIYA
ncbi:unnamed protein product, partial [Didymodactylos carnosus]